MKLSTLDAPTESAIQLVQQDDDLNLYAHVGNDPLMERFRAVCATIPIIPISSQTALAAGPVLLVMGAAFSLMRTAYWMLIPGFAYMVLIIVGGFALKGKIFGEKVGE